MGKFHFGSFPLLNSSTHFAPRTLLFPGSKLLILGLSAGRQPRITARPRAGEPANNEPRVPCCELRPPTLGGSLREVVEVNQIPARMLFHPGPRSVRLQEAAGDCSPVPEPAPLVAARPPTVRRDGDRRSS